jgi:phosphoadenosine phosphosulfate reductase
LNYTPDEIKRLAEEFEAKTPRDVLQWAADNFGSRVAISSAFGPEGLVILDIAMRKVEPSLPVFTIDTGFLFKETNDLIGKVEQEYSITVERLQPELTTEQQAEKHGPELFRREPDQCCSSKLPSSPGPPFCLSVCTSSLGSCSFLVLGSHQSAR